MSELPDAAEPRSEMRRASHQVVVALGAAVFFAACEAEPPATEPEPVSVESSAAGIRIAALPEAFAVSTNDSDGLGLGAASMPGPSSVSVTLSEEYQDGLNIVEAVQLVLDDFAARPAGESFGQTQLVAPIGLAYMARGRYEIDGAAVEELRAMLAHPWGNRLLSVAYTYPAGSDSSERGAQLMELLGEIEPLDPPAE